MGKFKFSRSHLQKSKRKINFNIFHLSQSSQNINILPRILHFCGTNSEIWCVFYTHSTSYIGPATFAVLGSHTEPLTFELENAVVVPALAN